MEGFFYESRALGDRRTKVLEFVYRTYPSAERILRMNWREGLELVSEGIKESQRREFWLMYCSAYPHMTQDNFQTFTDWYGQIEQPKETKMTKDEIMSKVESILAMV